MAMTDAFLNAVADYGGTLITHIALVNTGGTEVGDARQAVSWTAASAGLIRPTGDLVFNMTAGEEVAAWKGFSALTAGTDYGGGTLSTVTFGNNGTYTLEAANTAIDLDAV